MKSTLVAGLDVGSAVTCAVIAEAGDSGQEVQALGVGQARTEGVRGDDVTEIAAMTESIRAALGEAELMAGRTTDAVWVGIGGSNVACGSSLGVSAIARGEVTQDDIDRCHEVAQAVALPPDLELLHVIPQDYRVDGKAGIAHPAGMSGVRLECDAFVVTSIITGADHLRRAVNDAGCHIDGIVLEPLAAGRAILTRDEKELGVAVADVGSSSTSIAVFRENRVEHVSILPFGGEALTGDLARGLSLSYPEARRAKEQFGTAMADMVDPRESIDMPSPSPGQVRSVAREIISHIIEQRLSEVLTLVQNDIESAVSLEELSAGVVFCGGTAGIPGILELAERNFTCPVRIGLPNEGMRSHADGVARPRFAVATGLALWGSDLARAGGDSSLAFRLPRRAIDWLKDFF
ncbi:MAG: cell division protein FtsA [Gemmatimonadetes bacterium]|nr:cell division protein FtsA [Gemmatimonadota bacterium]